jgi:ABC-2 type transport system ATP-binding protein
MIEARELSRRYGGFTAVDRVSFAVDEGEIVGMLGPNGAGKTTAIRMITGFLPPSGGRVTVAGKDLFTEPRSARRQIGYLPENVALYPEMRVEEYLAYRARLEGMRRGEIAGAIAEVLDRCLLEEVRRQVIGTLSKGFRQRVGLAAANLHGPSVLVLAEPTVGLDPQQIIAIRELIRELGRQRTLLLSTHILPEVELLCDRVLIIDRGRIVAQGTPESLRESWRGERRLAVELRGAGPAGAEALAALAGVARAEPRPGTADGFAVAAEPGADPREAIFGLAVERGWPLVELTEAKASLEDVFVRLTTRDEPPAEPGALAAAEEPPGSAAETAAETDAETDAEPEPEAGSDEEVPS